MSKQQKLEDGRACTLCGVLKPFNCFWMRKKLNIPYAQCIDCMKAVREKRYQGMGSIDPNQKKICPSCNESKTLKDFPKNKNSPLGYLNICKMCFSLRNKLRVYSLTKDELDSIIDRQKGLCDLCELPFKDSRDMHVDHDHRCCDYEGSCGKCVRGIIHANCNVGIGLLGDSIEKLQKAIAYLEKYGCLY